MKLFLKILFFIFTMMITVGEVKSSAVITILREETSYSFFQKSQLNIVLSENYNTKSCVNGENVVTCSERVINTSTVVAKGGSKVILLSKLDNFPSLKNMVSRLDEVKDAALINKIDNLVATNSSKLADLEKLKFALPADRPMINGQLASGDFRVTRTIDGKSVSLYYDRVGFPDFVDKAPQPIKDFSFQANDLIGNTSSTDFTRATNSLIERFPEKNIIKKGNQVEIDGILHTWHHHQDGKTLMPVPSSIHNAVNHTGGSVIIREGLQGLFESPF